MKEAKPNEEKLTSQVLKGYARGEGNTMDKKSEELGPQESNRDSAETEHLKSSPAPQNTKDSSGPEEQNQKIKFVDPRLQDIAEEIAAHAETPSREFLIEEENRLRRILDDKDFVSPEARRQAKLLINTLQRNVPQEEESSLKQSMLELGRGGEGFAELQKFFTESAGKTVRNYEQLDEMHGKFNNAFNQEAGNIRDKISQLLKDKQQEIYRETVEQGKAPRSLTEDEYEVLTGELRKKTNALWETKEQYRNIMAKNFGTPRRQLTGEQQRQIKHINELEERIQGLDPERDKFYIKDLRKDLQKLEADLIEPLAPENEGLPDEILEAIAKDDFATEKFLYNLIHLPQENAPYRLPGFYSDVNLTKFLKVNEKLLAKSGKSERLENIVRGTETLHEMNRILKTSVDQFAQISQTILSANLTALCRIPGVEEVFGLYEGIIKENLAIETRITENVFDLIDRQVEKEFIKKAQLKKGESEVLIKGFKGEGPLEEWEMKRAIEYGRNMMRIFLREAEYISLSVIPQGAGAESNISLAEGQLLSIFHPISYTVKRFQLGCSTGGLDFANGLLDRNAKQRRQGKDGQGKRGVVAINTLQGTSIDNRELTKVLNTRGALMTWRVTAGMLKECAFFDNDKASNLLQFFDDHKGAIDVLQEISSHNAWGREFQRELKKSSIKNEDEFNEWKKERICRVFGPLLQNNAVALGALVSPIPLTVPTEVKEMLWEKIAELNPDVMASMLTRLEIDEKADGYEKRELWRAQSLEEILLDSFGTDDQRLMFWQEKDSSVERTRGLTTENRKNAAKALLDKKKTIEEQLKDARDQSSKEGLKKELKDIRGRLEWRPQVKRKEFSSLQLQLDELDAVLENKKIPDIKKDKARAEKNRITLLRDEVKSELDMLDDETKKLLRNPQWATVREKLRTINELRMSDERERMEKVKAFREGREQAVNAKSPKNYSEYLRDNRLVEKLSLNEQKVVDFISQNGKLLAQDLANIRQAHVWFLDDFPISVARWENLGQWFNRTINDFAQFSQGATELNNFLGDPYKMGGEGMPKARETLAKTISSAANVLGLPGAQDNVYEVVMQYDESCMADKKYRSPLVSAFRSMTWSCRE